jgi:MFS family permease
MSNVKKLQLVSLIGGMYYYTPIFTLFLLMRNLDLGFIVAAQTIFTVGMLISTIPTGILADKWGQKRTIQIGLFLDALGMFLLLLTRSPLGLIAFFGIRGIGTGFRDGADEALLYDSYVSEYGTSEGYSRSFGKLLSNDTLGFVVATAIAGLAVQFFGKASYVPLVIATGMTSLFTLLIASTLKNRRHIAEHTGRGVFYSQLKDGLKIVKKSRTIIALTVLGLLTLNGEYFLRQTYQPYFQHLAVPAIFLGVALSAGKLLNFIAMRNAHRLEKYLTVDKILLWINLTLGFSFILFALTRSAWSLVAIFMLIQALLNSQQPVVSDYINQQIASGQRSTTLSTVSFIQNMGQVVARVLLGISIGVIGLGHTFIAQGIYMLVGTVIGIWYIRRCGCVQRVTHIIDDSPQVALA